MFAGGTPGERRFVCMLCMHVYDEREGDPDSGIPPGTLWEDIPDTWRCPVCGAAKSYYEDEALFQQMTPRDENVPRDENAPKEETSELPPEGEGPAQG